MEQQFKLRRMKDLMPSASKADLITLIEALQHQNFCLTNTVSNLVKQWPAVMMLDLDTTDEEQSKSGISSEIRG
jgi:hypothetical protein